MKSLYNLLFGPKLGKIEDHHQHLLLHAIRTGQIKTVEPEPPESGIGRVWEWSNSRWNIVRKNEVPYPRFTDTEKPNELLFRCQSLFLGLL